MEREILDNFTDSYSDFHAGDRTDRVTMALRATILIHTHPSRTQRRIFLVLSFFSSLSRNLLAHLPVRQARLARLFPIVYFS